MTLHVWRFATLMLAALTTAMAFCHLMEMPARIGWGTALWVATTVTGDLFRMFGTVGALLEVGAVLATATLAFLVRRRGSATWCLTLAGATLYAAALAAWWALVFPANEELARWVGGDVPSDWAAWRDRWEHGHAPRAMLQVGRLAALILSVLVETPGGVRGADPASGRAGREALLGGR